MGADNDKECPSTPRCQGYTAVKMERQGVGALMEACRDFGGPALIFNEKDNQEAFRVCRDFAGERTEKSQCLIGLVQDKKSREPDEGWEWFDGSMCGYRAWVDGEPNDYGSGEDMA